jgi:hypothetical protein
METINVTNQDNGLGYDETENEVADQENYPENGNESQTEVATDSDVLETDHDDNLDDDGNLTDTDEDVNDVDGNGGYPDGANAENADI